VGRGLPWVFFMGQYGLKGIFCLYVLGPGFPKIIKVYLCVLLQLGAWEKRRGVRNSCPRLNLFYLFTSKCKCSVMHDINGNKTGKSFGDLN
jgi:hypothetical protein